MKILLIVDDYLPESTKIAPKMMHELALEFVVQSHEVLVVTPDSYQNYTKSNLNYSQLDGINVYRFPSGRLKNISKLLRLINEFLLPYRAWYHGKNIFKQKCFSIFQNLPAIFEIKSILLLLSLSALSFNKSNLEVILKIFQNVHKLLMLIL